MEFTLSYAGALKAGADAHHKHQLRRHFHEQLKLLWDESTVLSTYLQQMHDLDSADGPMRRRHFERPIKDFIFAPLANVENGVLCTLEVTLLRPRKPGYIWTTGGDIDNQLKTVFDALRLPKEDELPKNATRQPSEEPYFYCLVEDDVLITSVSVRTERLWEPAGQQHAILLVHAKLRMLGPSFDYNELAL